MAENSFYAWRRELVRRGGAPLGNDPINHRFNEFRVLGELNDSDWIGAHDVVQKIGTSQTVDSETILRMRRRGSKDEDIGDASTLQASKFIRDFFKFSGFVIPPIDFLGQQFGRIGLRDENQLIAAAIGADGDGAGRIVGPLVGVGHSGRQELC